MRTMAKMAFLWCYVYLLAPARNLWRRTRGTCHTTVLLYHRVSDECRDSITVGTSQFQRQLELLKRHYEVLSMTQFLQSRGTSRRRPAVVVTFDDGYQDNYVAAQLLRQANVPCTFFVSTGIVGTARSFPRDVRLKQRIPTLSWEQIHDMADWQFDIANHSVSHIDMGKASLAESLREIQQASQDLTAQLGARGPEKWLAYPFGRPQNMTPDLLERLQEAGIEYCFSAYGGINGPAFDPYNIVRQGVNYAVCDLAFRAIVEGHRVHGY